jgi:hypothetical protein
MVPLTMVHLLYYLVWETEVSSFGSFIVGSKKELNMKIWRSKYVWSMKKERRNIKEPTHVLTIKFDILVKNEVSDFPDRNIWFLQL